MNEKILELVSDIEKEEDALSADIEVQLDIINHTKKQLKALDKKKKQLLAMLEEE